MGVQKRMHNSLVLFRLQRAGRVDQGSTRPKVSKGVFQQGQLEYRVFSNLFRPQSPTDLRVALQGPRAGTRHVDENLVKPLEEWKRTRCVAGYPAQVLPILGMQSAANLKPVPMKIGGNYGQRAALQASHLRAL